MSRSVLINCLDSALLGWRGLSLIKTAIRIRGPGPCAKPRTVVSGTRTTSTEACLPYELVRSGLARFRRAAAGSFDRSMLSDRAQMAHV